MSKQTINVGSADLAGDGESIRNAFTKVNSNFTELYTSTSVLTIAILPSATPAGQRAFISNGENSPTWGATVGSTGTTTYPVWSNGSVWKYG